MISLNFLRARAVMDIFKDPHPATGDTRLWIPRRGIGEVVRRSPNDRAAEAMGELPEFVKFLNMAH